MRCAPVTVSSRAFSPFTHTVTASTGAKFGAVTTPVLGATLGGWVLALELTGVPFERRGLRYRDRKRMLKRRRPMAIGFGAATFVCFLIPLGAVLVMPAAVAGATLLSRRLFGLPDRDA